MKLIILNITIWNLFVFLILNCSIGTQRDTCRSNLKKGDLYGPSDDSCQFISVINPLTAEGSLNPTEFDVRKNLLLTASVLNCIEYYQKLKECDKEENRYIPSIYSKE
ncbi:hypothetical protein [Leptospira interrogans]|uniref:Uncharacterized protein n=1 Tax=Leptospira interrogans serovar Bataviae TaxID=312175 RepID=A0AAP9WQD6_LEPIR|nr:hypothetical protein [Leptospira interrogans]QOI53238.1 hypothetical protein Lepto1489_23075 [Leptospira interrogans serovar Bataviae]